MRWSSSRSTTTRAVRPTWRAQIADAGVNIDTIYVATNNRVVFHSADMDGLRKALRGHEAHLH